MSCTCTSRVRVRVALAFADDNAIAMQYPFECYRTLHQKRSTAQNYDNAHAKEVSELSLKHECLQDHDCTFESLLLKLYYDTSSPELCTACVNGGRGMNGST